MLDPLRLTRWSTPSSSRWRTRLDRRQPRGLHQRCPLSHPQRQHHHHRTGPHGRYRWCRWWRRVVCSAVMLSCCSVARVYKSDCVMHKVLCCAGGLDYVRGTPGRKYVSRISASSSTSPSSPRPLAQWVLSRGCFPSPSSSSRRRSRGVNSSFSLALIVSSPPAVSGRYAPPPGALGSRCARRAE